MDSKYAVPAGEPAPPSQIGAALEALGATIAQRADAGEASYTFRLLNGPADKLLKKVMEEAGEVALAAKDAEAAEGAPGRGAILDHLRYEAADELYHLLVVLQRYGIAIDELAAELNTRMEEGERPRGGVLLKPEFVNRG